MTYNNVENLAQLVREISWSKNVAIMEKCKDQKENPFEYDDTAKIKSSKLGSK